MIRQVISRLLAVEHVDARNLSVATGASLILGTPLGFVVTPGVLFAPQAFPPILMVSLVCHSIAIPTACACIRARRHGFVYSLVAGTIFGGLGGLLGTWFWDCLNRCTIFCDCSDQPILDAVFYGIPFGLASSALFWSVLRQTSPKAFQSRWPMPAEKIAARIFLTLLVGGFVAWGAFRLGLDGVCGRCLA